MSAPEDLFAFQLKAVGIPFGVQWEAANGPATRQRPGPWSHLDERRDMAKTTPPAERFWAKVDKSGECWLWTGAQARGRYGSFDWPGQPTKRAHRLSWIMANGPVPEGMEVCHHCDVRLCVRPDHLFAGTRSDNVRDMVAKGRGFTGYRHPGAANPQAKLTWDQVDHLRRERERGVTIRELAAWFGISKFTVKEIIYGRRYIR